MPHTHLERLATISASQVEEHFRDLHPIVALVSATRLLQFLEREGLLLHEHRALCASIIRKALPSLENGPGHPIGPDTRFSTGLRNRLTPLGLSHAP